MAGLCSALDSGCTVANIIAAWLQVHEGLFKVEVCPVDVIIADCSCRWRPCSHLAFCVQPATTLRLQNCELVAGSRRLQNSSGILVKGTLIAEGQLARS